MTKLAIEEALKQKAKQDERDDLQIEDEGKKDPSENDALKPAEEVKEIETNKVEIHQSRREDIPRHEDNLEGNTSPERTNLLRSSIVPLTKINEMEDSVQKLNFNASRMATENDHGMNGIDGFPNVGRGGDSIFKRKPTIKLESEIPAVQLDG